MSDLIRREDAIEAIHSYWKGELSKMPTTDSEYGEVIDGDCDTLLKHNKELSTRINAIPSADRPQGKWIYIDEPMIGNPYGRYKCSECNLEEPFTSDFCPNCGSKMRGEHDD